MSWILPTSPPFRMAESEPSTSSTSGSSEVPTVMVAPGARVPLPPVVGVVSATKRSPSRLVDSSVALTSAGRCVDLWIRQVTLARRSEVTLIAVIVPTGTSLARTASPTTRSLTSSNRTVTVYPPDVFTPPGSGSDCTPR